jgi:ATP-dependent DNA helicase DinG
MFSPDDIPQLFADDGPLASQIAGYRTRPQQVEMASAVARAVADNRVLIAEAGTGTGKTYAYLVPALLSGGKVIVSTGTKTLQDQLFSRDIPTVRKVLGAPVKVALLKGRANYVCHYHLERALAEGRFASREDAAYARSVLRFVKTTQSGDKAECADVPENATVWNMVTSTRDNCLGQDCPQHKECFVLAARREAQSADVVVVNHHLFFADVMLRDEGAAELLPACNAVIFDEAHQLPETASLFFGDSVSTSQILDLCRDARGEGLSSARDCLDLPEQAKAVEKAAKDLRLTVGIDMGRFAASQLAGQPEFAAALLDLSAKLEVFAHLLESQAQRSEGLEKCWQRALALIDSVDRWRTSYAGEAKKGEGKDGKSGAFADNVYWVEAFTHSLQLNATPLSIARIFRKQMAGHPRAWIFTSATLAVQKSFSHYQAEMGLLGATTTADSDAGDEQAIQIDTGFWESPFDYGQQAMLYCPTGLPEPNSAGYTEAVVEAAFPLLKVCGGGAFFLCTSLRAMRRTHELLAAKLADAGMEMPLMLQGEASKTELLDRFRFHGASILVGSQSFWEGVDVRGEALSLVVIDKLPFSPPDDPVLAARIEKMNREGRNAFMEYQLPRAVINVKQGAGRLIRDETDHGVLMICDPRLISKPYGKRIWRSLPPMRRSRELGEALAFFESIR